MPRTRLAMLTLLVAPAFALAAPRLKDRSEAKPYYPTIPGTTLVFDDCGRERTWEVSSAERRGEETIVTLTEVSEGVRSPLETVSVSGRGVYRLTADRFKLDPHPVFPFPVRQGTTWDFYLPAQEGLLPQLGTVTIGPTEDVDTPAGTFRAVRVEMVVTLYEGKRLVPPHVYTKWHHPDLGQVKITGPDGFCRALKSVTSGK
jgi:hypothetical protein